MLSPGGRCGGCPFAQPQTEDISSISYPRRFVIYIVGVIETLLFGGCIFGWAQLVHVLKTEEVFLDLCHGLNNGTLSSNSSGLTDQQILRGCDEQSQAYALIYTIACVVFGLPAFLMGMILHYCGLAAGRFIGSILLTTGFISLSFTTKETPYLLYAAMMCLAVGGNQLRMAGYQFCDLFPTYRATALTIISGSYAASAALFMVFQLGSHFGISLWGVSITLAGIASFSIPMTFLMPWHHIPNRDAEIAKESKKSSISLKTSLLSVSSLTHNVWYTVNLLITTSYGLAFNSWISSIAETTEEAGLYSLMYSLSCLASPFLSPFPGMLMDYLARAPPDATEKERVFRRIRSTIIPIAFVTVLSLLLRISLFFKDPKAIYCSLVFMVLLRTWTFATATTFIKNRFPAEHFIRMAGIQSSVSCTIDFLQYYIFIWSQKDFEASMIFLICLLCVTFVHALHILPKKNLQKIVDNLFEPNENLPERPSDKALG